MRDTRTIFMSVVFGLLLTPALFGLLQLIEDSTDSQLNDTTIAVAYSTDLSEDPLIDFLQQDEKYELVESSDPIQALEDAEVLGYISAEQQDGFTSYAYVTDSKSNVSGVSTNFILESFSIFTAQVQEQNFAELEITQVDVNPYSLQPTSLQDITGEIVQSPLVLFFLPYVILVGLITGAQQYAIELTAGEKERKTLATTLSLDVPTSVIAAAKISVVLIISLVSVAINIASIFIASEVFNLQEQFGISIGVEQLWQLAVVLLPLALLTSSAIVLIGLYARNQKEAGVYLSPILIGSIVFGFTADAFDANTTGAVFLAPLLGHIGAIKQILLGEFILSNVALVVLSSLVLAILSLVAAVRMFRSEEVLFRE